MRVFLDANILFSAARSDGAIRRFISLLIADGHELCLDPYVLEEARRNLNAKTPTALPFLSQLSQKIRHLPLPPRDRDFEATLPLPEKDQPVLASAIHSRCDCLLTGDRTHFGSLYHSTLHGVRILSPAHLAEEIL